MRLDLPLSRGHVDALVPLRERLEPTTLLSAGAEAVRTAAPQIDEVSAFVVGSRGEIALVADEDGEAVRPPRLYRPTREEALALAEEGDGAYFIGATSDGTAHVAVSLTPDADRATAAGEQIDTTAELEVEDGRNRSWTWANLRWCGFMLEADESALAVSAVALAAWHSSSRFCSRCGSAVEPTVGGWASKCGGCGRVEFPRHDPAIIVLVLDGHDRALLAHNVNWKGAFASTIAGFVEAGESPDLTVARELMEEVGVEIREPTYVGTQPWPFPRSQMLGYTARTVADEVVPVPDHDEIAWAHFYSREELTAAIAAGEIEPPGRSSIAYAMLRDWYGGDLPLPPNAADPLRLPW